MGNKKRSLIQIVSALILNSNFKGFVEGTIYKGKTKGLCTPGINCYSCPGAMGACPIGSLQAVIGSIRFKFSYYVLGVISLFGVVLGRAICAWLCPFGFIQELLNKIPIPKIKTKEKVHNVFKYMKYVILLIFVILLPMLLVDEIGMSDPYFCKLICPVGTLEGGIPLVILNTGLRESIGFLFKWKITLLALIIVLSIMIYRPFCKYLCPLGAIYALFNHISFYRLTIDKNKCTACGACTKACKMHVKVYKNPNCGECIRCGDCIKVCSRKAIKGSMEFRIK